MSDETKPKKTRTRRPQEKLIAESLLNLKTMQAVVTELVAQDREATELLLAKLSRALGRPE